MPKKKAHLAELIFSLTRSEKRYFRMSVTGGEDAVYLKLFGAYEKNKRLNDAELREKFKGFAFIRQPHVARNYLYEAILRSLRGYYSQRSAHSMILGLLLDIELMYTREQFDACMLKILKAQKLAITYEKHNLLLEIFNWKRRLMLNRAAYGSTEIKQLLKEEKHTLQKLRELHGYWYSTLAGVSGNRDIPGKIRNEGPSTMQALVLHRHANYSKYFMSGKPREGEREISLLIKELEKKPLLISDDPAPYATAVTNKIGLMLMQKRWRVAEKLLSVLRELPQKYRLSSDSKFTLRLRLRVYNLELEMCRDRQDLKRGTLLSSEVEGFMKGREAVIPADYRLMLKYQIASICFSAKNYSGALRWVNGIINDNYGSVRVELQCFARLLNLMVHFELGNIIVLRYAIDSAKRFLKKNKRLGEFEKQALAVMSGLGKAEKREITSVFNKGLEDFGKIDKKSREWVSDHLDWAGWLGRTGRD